jgi:hypothetical protein
MAIFRNGQTGSKARVAAKIVSGDDGVLFAFSGANTGRKIFLVSHSPSPGRRVTQTEFIFLQPTGMLRYCASDHEFGRTRSSASPSYLHHYQHASVEILASMRVIGAAGQVDDFTSRPLNHYDRNQRTFNE